METPPSGTVERWAWDYILTTDLAAKLAPSEVPAEWETNPPPRRIAAPGRPAQLHVVARSPRRPESLKSNAKRAQLMHTFFHHELQAAELMCFALLAFATAPRGFRRGLLAICLDEVRHMRLYAEHIARLGHRLGDFPVRDWFWQRIPSCTSPLEFVAVMGMGFEGGNLDHAALFAERFEAAGDDGGAAIQRTVGHDEIAHVRFATRWFERFTGGQDFETWSRSLPAPLSPLVMRGAPINRAARRAARMDDAFVAKLEAFQPNESGPRSVDAEGAQPRDEAARR